MPQPSVDRPLRDIELYEPAALIAPRSAQMAGHATAPRDNYGIRGIWTPAGRTILGVAVRTAAVLRAGNALAISPLPIRVATVTGPGGALA